MIDKQRLLATIKPWTRIDNSTQFARSVKKSNIEVTPSGNITAPDYMTRASLSTDAQRVGDDLATNFSDIYRDRPRKLNMSVRRYENAIEELIRNSLVEKVDVGKILLHAPTKKLFSAFGLKCPYKRLVHDIKHAFLCLVTVQLLKANPLVENAECEVPIGDLNSTIDAVSYRKDGKTFAYEITLKCTSNIAANAQKLWNKGFAQVIFVCLNSNVKQAIWAAIRDAGFDPNFRSIIRVVLFSNLFHQKKQFSPGVNK
jgi:hypothetical protein